MSIFLALVALGVAPLAAATIRYRVSLDHGDQHLFQVHMVIPALGQSETVALPVWNTLYRIEDFAYRVRDVRAEPSAIEDGAAYALRKIDKQTWQIRWAGASNEVHSSDVAITYFVEWDDVGPFNSQLDAHHAFINLAEILMYVPERRSEDTEITFEGVPPGWRVAAELVAGPAPYSFVAPSYGALVDAPVEAGRFDSFEFDSGGAHFRVVVDAARGWNRGFLEDALRRITAYDLRLMGGPPFDPPNREFTFIFHIGPNDDVEGGGMEHRNSTAIASSSAEGAAFYAAHEFFHAWNVKRIRPEALEPVDYTKEQYTRALWFAEGVTSTYGAYALERTGLWSKSQFYGDLAYQIGRLQSRPARRWQSAEESSLDAWFEKYDGYNAPDRSISYYNKGQILGVLLDLAIRDATDNRKSLDDVLRRMNDEYARQGKFYNESEGIRAAVEEVAGKSFQEFFRRYVSGTDEIPYADFLGIAGLELKMEGAQWGASRESNAHAAISEISHPTDKQLRIRDGILRGSTN
ncbi:MAG TPA: hypothetical protein VJO53_13195 [Candidatus Acidoferrales bacterium]|nr:hypothetical protein [Candidatus Acidoferrales bacterium]